MSSSRTWSSTAPDCSQPCRLAPPRPPSPAGPSEISSNSRSPLLPGIISNNVKWSHPPSKGGTNAPTMDVCRIGRRPWNGGTGTYFKRPILTITPHHPYHLTIPSDHLTTPSSPFHHLIGPSSPSDHTSVQW